MTTLISLVTGTYNRLRYLSQMVDSFRANLARGMAYEIIVIDGGSTDGTIRWCEQQPDIRLIQHGELRGAIRAFTDGGYAARGEYVLLANDDIAFEPYSIMPALVHLETHPTCGAVAFADDRPAPGYGDGFKVQTISVNVSGHEKHLPYAQVGLFRRWLGDVCGWWGADDVGFGGHTYGGDNYLSARIWEHGYSVETVDACRVKDFIPKDGLRAVNEAAEKKNPGAYYKRYPKAPAYDTLSVRHEHDERLRVLYLPIYEPFEKAQQLHKRGLREAFGRVGLVFEVDYRNTRPNLKALADSFQPHILFTQCHHPSDLRADTLAVLRAEHPDMLIVNWNGDVYEKGLVTPEMLAWLKHVDLQLVVNASVLKTYADNGIQARYWQVAYEPVNEDALPDMPAHDVVFLGNAYTPARKLLGTILQNTPGVNVGIYGRGWQWANGETTYDFPKGAALYRNAKIAVGDNQYPDQRGFVSNRIFEALASGVFLLHQTVPGLEDLTGLQDGVHYVSWVDSDDLMKQIRHYLEKRRDDKRRQIAEAGQAFVREHHSFDKRVEQLLDWIAEFGEPEYA